MADLGTCLNCVSNKEYSHKIKRFNRTANERAKSAQAAMPFRRISKLIIIHLVAIIIFWLNEFPQLKPGSGMHNTKGSVQLVLRIVVDYKKV